MLLSSNQKYPHFPLLLFFSVVVCLRCLWLHILLLIPSTFRETGNLFSLLLCSLWWVQMVGYVLAWRAYSFICTLHHLIIIICANLPQDIKLIKCLSDIFCRVCEYDKAYSLSYLLYNMWGCEFSVYLFPLWCLREYIYFVILLSSYRKYELLPIV